MNKKFVNITFLVFWVVLGLGVFFRDWWMPAEVREKVSDEKAQLMILVAVVFTLWNLARFFAAYRLETPTSKPSPEVEAYRRKIRAMSGHDPKVTDPQFNFDDPAPPAGPTG
jgi:hypothetical protein